VSCFFRRIYIQGGVDLKRILPFVLAVCLLLSCAALAVTLPDAPNGYTYDEKGIVSELNYEVIALNNQNLAKACGAEIFIVVVKDTDTYDSEGYTYMLMNDWGVGDEKEDNGFMLLLALRGGNDNGCWLGTGNGAERILSAYDAEELLEEYFYQYYEIGNYEDGIMSLFEALFCRVRDFYGLNLAYQDASVVKRMMSQDGYEAVGGYTPPAGGNKGGSTVIWVIVIVVILVIALGGGTRRRRMRRGPGMPPPPPRAPRATRPPMGGGYRPPMGGAPMGGTPRSTPASRPSGGLFGGGSSRPSGGIFGGSSRPSGGSSRPSSFSRPSSAGRVTRGGGSSRGSGAGRGR